MLYILTVNNVFKQFCIKKAEKRNVQSYVEHWCKDIGAQGIFKYGHEKYIKWGELCFSGLLQWRLDGTIYSEWDF